MVAMLSSQYLATRTSQIKRRERHRRPVSSGARKMGSVHEVEEEERIPACWKEKTMRTVEAMSRIQPVISSCFQQRRRLGVIWWGLGQAITNIINGMIPMGGLRKLEIESADMTGWKLYLIQNTHLHVV